MRLAESVEIETVESCLAQTDEMQRHLTESRIKAKRVDEIEAERDALLQDLNELRMRLMPASRVTTVDLIERDFAELDRKLREAQGHRVRRSQLEKEIEAKRRHLDDVVSKLRDVESKMTALAKEAGVSNPALIPDAIERAASAS